MIHATYWPEDDILEVRLSEKSIARETPEHWNVHKSYAEDGELVEIVFLDAVKQISGQGSTEEVGTGPALAIGNDGNAIRGGFEVGWQAGYDLVIRKPLHVQYLIGQDDGGARLAESVAADNEDVLLHVDRRLYDRGWLWRSPTARHGGTARTELTQESSDEEDSLEGCGQRQVNRFLVCVFH